MAKADDEFNAWYEERYGISVSDPRNIRLVPMDLREAWLAARRFSDTERQLLLQSLRQSANHTYPESEAEYEALIAKLSLED